LEKVLQIVIIIDLTSKTSRLGLAGTTRAVYITRNFVYKITLYNGGAK